MRGQDDVRAPVWLAISEFYLDTELQVDDLERIASTLARSPYSLDELHDIERFEVTPVLWGNLLAVAGEWEPWDRETLIPLFAARAALGRGWLRRLATAAANPFCALYTKHYWSLIEKRVIEFRTAT